MADPDLLGSVDARARSVYGMRLTGLDGLGFEVDDELAPPTDGGGPGLIPVTVTRSAGAAPRERVMDQQGGVRSLPDGRTLQLDRASGRATFYGPPLSPDMIAHPYLGPIAAGFNRWAGREVFHAGAFVAAGRAFMVLGPRTAGKSTLMAAIAATGAPILADDLVVTDGEVVFAGPRSVDLREPIPGDALAAPLPELRPARDGTRWRVPLPAIASRYPLGGWFCLRWSDRSAADPVPMTSLLGRLAVYRSMGQLESDPTVIMDLISRPAWDLRRPRCWADLPATVDLLLGTATAAVPGTHAVTGALVAAAASR